MLKIISYSFLAACLLNFYYAASQAQDTFSITAVDLATGQVGSAGASCVQNCIILSDVHPGLGVIHTQAYYNATNQNYARTLMNMGLSPQQIIDSLVAHDAQGNPTIRQYGIVDNISGGRTAAYTGENCNDWKGHLLGMTYTIQGNILLGPQILDSMRSRFVNTTGTLADKLMAALQGAKVPGADTRCANKSSISAFLRVARPTDSVYSLWLDLRVNNTPATVDPIDSLQVLYNIWLTSGINPISGEIPAESFLYQNYPNPFNPRTAIRFQVPGPASVKLSVFDILGRELDVLVDEKVNAGTYEVYWDAQDYPSGVYYYKLTTGDFTDTKKMIVVK